MSITSFNPPVRTLMGPGPSDVSPRVLGALSRPTIGHLDPLFVQLMDEIKGLLQYAFQTDNALTLPISAPGSAGASPSSARSPRLRRRRRLADDAPRSAHVVGIDRRGSSRRRALGRASALAALSVSVGVRYGFTPQARARRTSVSTCSGE